MRKDNWGTANYVTHCVLLTLVVAAPAEIENETDDTRKLHNSVCIIICLRCCIA